MWAGCRTTRAGLSLVEVMLAAGLSLLAFALISQYLVPMLSLQHRGEERADMQRQSSAALDRIRQDLSWTVPAGVSLSPTRLGIHPIDGVTAQSDLMWQLCEILYTWDPPRGLLTRSVFKDPGASVLSNSVPVRLGPASLAQAASLSGDMRTLAVGVVDFQVQQSGTGPNPTFPLTVHLELEGLMSRRRFHLDQTVAVRTP